MSQYEFGLLVIHLDLHVLQIHKDTVCNANTNNLNIVLKKYCNAFNSNFNTLFVATDKSIRCPFLAL